MKKVNHYCIMNTPQISILKNKSVNQTPPLRIEAWVFCAVFINLLGLTHMYIICLCCNYFVWVLIFFCALCFLFYCYNFLVCLVLSVCLSVNWCVCLSVFVLSALSCLSVFLVCFVCLSYLIGFCLSSLPCLSVCRCLVCLSFLSVCLIK